MAAIDDLTNAITVEEANITAVQTYLQTILAELAALQGGATAAQIQALTAKITTDADLAITVLTGSRDSGSLRNTPNPRLAGGAQAMGPGPRMED